MAGKPERARDILLRLERLYPAGVRFPFDLDLASASSLAGDWYQAILSYRGVLRDDQLDASLRASVRRALDALYREHLPALRIGASDLDAGTGNVQEYGATTRSRFPFARGFRRPPVGSRRSWSRRPPPRGLRRRRNFSRLPWTTGPPPGTDSD